MTSFDLTALYAGLAGLFYLALSLQVSLRRRALRLSAGDGGDATMALRIRKHGNFAEYAPITLILLGLCEAQGTPAPVLHAGGLMLLLSRGLHAYGLGHPTGYRLRSWGMILCYLLLMCLSLLTLWLALA